MRSARADAGQALVEFALVLPLILLLVFGMVQFGFVLSARQTVANAAQAAAGAYAQTLQRDRGGAAAARIAAQLRPPLSPGDVRYAIHAVPVGSGGGAGNPSASADIPISADGVGQPGDFVVATVAYRYPSPVRAAIAGFRFPDSFTLTAEGVARIEKQGTAASGGGVAGKKCYFVRMQQEGSAPAPAFSFDGGVYPLYAAPGTSHTRHIRVDGAAYDGGVNLPADQSPVSAITLEGSGLTIRLLATYAVWPGCR